MRNTMNYAVINYILYLAISTVFTVWVAGTLHRNGRVFLVDVFTGNTTLADSVNSLLVVGFYLINTGFVFFRLKVTQAPINAQQLIETLSVKVGLVVLILGAMHFLNLFIFAQMRVNRQKNELAERRLAQREKELTRLPPPLPR